MKKKGMYLPIVIITLFLNLCMLYFFVHSPAKKAFSHTSEETLQRLEQQAQVSDVNTVTLAVEDAKYSLAILNDQMSENIALKFNEAIILGDSITEGLLDYGLMNESNCRGIRGARTNNMEATYRELATRKPKYIFLGYGMNDLGYFRGYSDMFIESYEKMIQMIQKDLPNAKVFINAILPITPEAIAGNAIYAEYQDFNRAMQAMCNKYDLTYIDNSFIIEQSEDPYEFDGVHPKYPFYERWLRNMAKVAGL